MEENWNAIFSVQHHPYRDRHWLWQLIPELFPLPPTQEVSFLKTKFFICPICKLKIKFNQEVKEHKTDLKYKLCPHNPTWSSQINLYDSNLKQLSVPFALEQPIVFSVLDVGCGTGATCFPLLEKNGAVKITAFDFSKQAISNAKERRFYDEKRLSLCVDDATKFNLGQFDFVLIIFVLSSILEVKNVILMAKAAVKNGGICVIVDYSENDYRIVRRESQQFEYGVVCQRAGDSTILIGFNILLLKKLIADVGMIVYEELEWIKVEKNRKTGQTFERAHFMLKFGIQVLVETQ
ncbi:Methyltransferase-like protein [Spironucleus salmonicida]|uniref:Methyltransferase-like protein n=1 Tax=Spironucleus salmonicida TaxID=348837 RepID=V6LVD6_9EUKA|nr:Methyltransferase-like protein [Spironucleus salmonicida]|eukprot:EST48612.1 Methyltransferase-like protein [Spironucleus salmonicida]